MQQQPTAASIEAAVAALNEPWQPVVLARANDAVVRLARMDGAFPWHTHEREDELFVCWRGNFRIEIEGEPPVTLSPGDLYTVLRGVRHRPVADAGPAYALIIEREETQQYGG
jgi:quercetin dioxygenase-like cupin family protein